MAKKHDLPMVRQGSRGRCSLLRRNLSRQFGWCRPSAPSDYPSGKEGDVLTVDFTVADVPCIGLNGGPTFKHNEAFSFQIATDDQKETTATGTPSSAMAARKARVAGAKTSGASPGKSRRAC